MTDEVLLMRLTGEDTRAAEQAFNVLFRTYHLIALGMLRRKYFDGNREDAENAVQQAFVNLWQARHRLDIPNIAAWRGLLRLTAERCYIDIVKAKKPEFELPPELPMGSGEEEIVETIRIAFLLNRLNFAADVLWLGLDPALTLEEHNRRLLAAQLFYLEEWSLKEITQMLSRTRPEEAAVSIKILEGWLRDPAVLRQVAYSRLYFTRLALTVHLLGLPEETEADHLETLLSLSEAGHSALPGLAEWNWHEVHAILWRYHRNVLHTVSPGIPLCTLQDSELVKLFVICRNKFPFSLVMKNLLYMTQGQLGHICGEKKTGLWRRLAFQYCYRNSLTHQDIHDRIEPAAQQVEANVSLIVLQGWISDHRLLGQLAAQCKKLYEGGLE